MPKINKTRSGLLLFENFLTNSLVWTPSPNGYEDIQFDGVNGLRILHSTNYKTFTIEEPQENYGMICKIKHTPMDSKDIGGIIVMSNDTTYAECQSYIATKPSNVVNANQTEQLIINFVNKALSQYLDNFVEYTVTDDTSTYPEPNPEIILDENGNVVTPPDPAFVDTMYPYIKMSKLDGIYTFLASTDMKTWIEVGNTELVDSNRVGFFLYSYDIMTDEIRANSSFFVESVMFYTNNYVMIDNIATNQTVELRDSLGKLVCSTSSPNVKRVNKQVLIDTTLMPTPYDNLTIKVLQAGKLVYSYDVPQLIGGDIYTYWHDIKLSINQVEISQEQLFDLGTFYHNDQTIRLDLYNNELYTIENLTVSITSYSIYYGGNETIGVSLYDENEVNYSFTDSVIIPMMEPTTGKSILIKLTDKVIQDFYKKEGEYRFKINIE